MSKLFNWAAARLVAAFALALPLAAMASTTYSTDHTVTGSGTAYTSSAGNANVTWQNFNFRAAISKEEIEEKENAGGDAHGYYFYLTDGDTDIGESDAAVNLDSITVTWGGNAGGDIAVDDTPYLVVTTADDTPVIIGISGAGDAFAFNGTSTFMFSGVVLASNAKYRFYFTKDVSGLSVGATLSGAQQARVNGWWHNKNGDARADYNDIRCSGGSGYSINCSFDVSSLVAGDAVVRETSVESVSFDADSDVPVVIEGKVEGGTVEVGSDVSIDGVFTVCGKATTLELTDSLTATAFYFPATVTIDASAVSGLDPTGAETSKTTALLSGALKYTTEPTVVLPTATAGMIYETSVTASGISVTVIKGVDCVETITGDTSWSEIKPAGWIDSLIGDKPAIAITYEGENPVTLTFDVAVMAGSLTLTGNIVVEASAAATFGTVTAGAGSVVDMSNMSITTQSGAGTYRYRSDYPSTVPNQSLTYEYVGTDDPEHPGTVNLNGMRGTVKTTGYMSITGYYPLNTASRLEVVSGTTTLSAGAQGICGYITIRENATLKNLVTDSLAYSSYSSIIDIYGTLDMGTSRWTVWSGAMFNLRGGEITGVGEGNNGAIDLMGVCNVTVYANSTISANVKFRNALSNITVNEGVTLTISGVTKPGYDGGGITKKGAGTLKFTSNPYVPAGIVAQAGTLVFDTESAVTTKVRYISAPAGDLAFTRESNWKGTIITEWAGNSGTALNFNRCGVEGSLVEIPAQTNSAAYTLVGYIPQNGTVDPTLKISGTLQIANGYNQSTATYRAITGTGTLNFSFEPKDWIKHKINVLTNFTGTIQCSGKTRLQLDAVALATIPDYGEKVESITFALAEGAQVLNASGQQDGEIAIVGSEKKLEFRDGALYVCAAPPAMVTITVPAVDNATATVTVGGETVEPTTVGGSDYEVVEGSTVTITYAANDGYELSGTAVYTIENAAEGSTITITDTETVPYVATFNGTSYTSLSAAVSAWAVAGIQDAATKSVVLTANVTEDVTIPVNANLAEIPLQLQGSATINGTVAIVDGATFAPFATVVLGGDVSVTGTLYRIGSATVSIGGDLTIADGATLAATALDAVNPVYSVTGDVVVEGVLNISLTSTTLAGGTYKVVTGTSVTRDEGADVVVFLNTVENDNWVLSSTSTELTITGAAATVDGEKFAEFTDAVTAAGGVKTITLLNSASWTLTVGETLIVEAGEFTMTVTPPAGYALVETAVSAGVVAYTSQQYVARVQNPVPQTATYYPAVDYTSLAEAFDNAESGALVTLLADDRVSFADGGQILIDKALTINGAGYTIYGKSAWTAAEINNVRDNKGADPTLVHGVKVVGSGNVTIKNVAFTEFADATFCNKGCAYAVFAPDTYTGTITLDGVQVDKFNRTAIDICGGTFEITNCVVTCNATGMGSSFLVFQQPVQFKGAATGRVVDSTVTGFCANFPAGTAEEEFYDAGGIVSWSSAPVAIVDCTVTTDNAHSFGIESDGTGVVTISGTTVAAASSVGYCGDGTSVVITSGDYTGELYGSGNGSLAVSGGTFDRQVPAAYCASGKVPTTTPDASGKYTVVDAPSGIDPASGVTETTVAYENTGSLTDDELTAAVVAAAVTASKITPPTGASVTPEAYAAYFTYTVTGDSGNYTLAIAGLQPTVLEDVDASVAAQLVSTTTDSDMTVTVKPGLYYGFTTGTTLTLAEPELQLSTGETVKVSKPGTTQGFVKIKVSATNN